MTHSPNPGSEQDPNPNQASETDASPSAKQRRHRRLLIGVGGAVLVGIGAGVAGAWYFIDRRLVPLVESNLENIIGRPLELGDVEAFSLTGLRLGETVLPPTETDPDRAIVEAVEVEFDLLPLITRQALPLRVTLIEPEAYVEQNEQGEWISVELNLPEEEGPIAFEVQQINADDADVILVPRGISGQLLPPVDLVIPSARSNFNRDNTIVQFALGGYLDNRPDPGQFEIQGEARLEVGEVEVAIAGNNLEAGVYSRLVATPMATITDGLVDADLEATIAQTGISGLAGSASIEDVAVSIEGLTNGLSNTDGRFRFAGTEVIVEAVTTRFEDVEAVAEGIVDLQGGLDLRAAIERTTLSQWVAALALEVPQGIELAGSVVAEAEVTGNFEVPLIAVTATNATEALLVDEIVVDEFSANVQVVETDTLIVDGVEVVLATGGELLAEGRIGLTEVLPNAALEIALNEIDGRGVRPYLPSDAEIGDLGVLNARAEISGAIANWQQLDVQGTANLEIASGNLTLGTIRASAGQLEIAGEASGIQPQQIAPQLPLTSAIAANFNLDANLDDFDLENIDATATGEVDIAGGTISAPSLELDNGVVEGAIAASGIQVGQLIPQAPPQLDEAISGNLDFVANITTPNIDRIRATGSGQLTNVAGGTITAGNIELANGTLQTPIEVSSVRVGQFIPQAPPQLDESLFADLNLSLDVSQPNLENVRASGSARLNLAGGTITAANIDVLDGNVQTLIDATNVDVSRFAPRIPTAVNDLAGNLAISADLSNPTLARVRATGSGRLNVAGGIIRAATFNLVNGELRAAIAASDIQLGMLLPPEADIQETISGNLAIAADLDNLDPDRISGNATGELNFAGGSITLTTAQIEQGNFQIAIDATGIQGRILAPTVPPEFQGVVSADLTVAGDLANLTPEAIVASGSAQLTQLGGDGRVLIQDLQAEDGNFSLSVVPQNLPIGSLSPQLEGDVSGQIQVAGNLGNLSPAGINAEGELLFDRGIAIITNPLTTEFAWTGDRFLIEEAIAENFAASGFVDINLDREGLELIEQFNLDVNAQNLDLGRLPIPDTPATRQLQVQGLADFSGDIFGTPTAPNVDATVALENLAINQLDFDPVLAGTINIDPARGASIQLTGSDPVNPDAIAATLTSTQREDALFPLEPQSFLFRRDEAVARGNRQGEQFLISASNIPISPLKSLAPLPPALAAQPAGGELTAEVTLNLQTLAARGQIALTDPRFGRLRGDLIAADFQYDNPVFELNQGELVLDESQFLLSVRANLAGEEPSFEAQLNVPQARLQDLLVAGAISDFSDLGLESFFPDVDTLGSAADLQGLGISVEGAAIETRLRRLAEVEALLLQQRIAAEEAMLLPPLTSVRGTFSGTATIAGTPSDLEAEFDFQGSDWQYGPYIANQVVAQGDYENGVLALNPVRLQSENRFINLAGTLGGETQSAQLQVEDIPIEAIEEVVELPPTVDVSGLLDATVTVAGSQANPSALGEIEIENAELNQTPVETVRASFNYANAVFDASAQALLEEGSQPLMVDARVPYQLPIAEVPPPSDRALVQVSLEDEGFTFLNVLTRNQITWVEGDGSLNLTISGPFDPNNIQLEQFAARGNIDINGATVRAQALADPLTDLNSEILFNFNQVAVQNLEGNIGGGTVEATGTLPLFGAGGGSDRLNVALNELNDVNLKGLYRGGVRGDLLISGSAVQPNIGGELQVFDGRVLLGAAPAGNGGAITGDGEEEGETLQEATDLDDLLIVLDEDIEISLPPILSIFADGSLAIGGTLANPRPEGTVELTRGEINLFTTQFRLAQGFEQTARFIPNRGLDPILDLRLVARVTETTRPVIPTDSTSAEIEDVPATSLGSVETVQVIARVEGPASQLQSGRVNTDILELSSEPARSDTEIIALLGGGFLGGGNGTLALASLAGSTLFSSIQNTLGNALGLTELRIFPTFAPEAQGESSALALAAEAVADLNNDFSVSVLGFLTIPESPRLNVLYRLNSQTLLRGSTDTAGEDSRLSVEYEARF